MRVTIAPASPKTGAATIRALLANAPPSLEIHALYRNAANAPAEFMSRANFRALQGDVTDPSTLDLTGSDAVLAITPPAYDSGDPLKFAEIVSKNIKDAIERSATVKRLVLLSSGGAQFNHGVGEIRTNNIAETVLAATNVRELVFVRCTFFMENWTASLETLQTPEPFFFSTITPLDWKVPMVATRDIGLALAAELIKQPESGDSSGPFIFDLHGPQEYSSLDVQAAFSSALGKKVELRAVERDGLHGYFAQVFPPAHVDLWVEMSLSFLPGGILAPDKNDYDNKPIVHGRTELLEAIKDGLAGL
ncbi:hypothetical protein PT974_02185 [Cladobotryum mycophilum]|uniref:NAD(P)-binding domain-containing protein n=1 Tax=Cladobotryum mycophilum TaxID=491253 RepID=A0ABR0SYK9_9HYPO